MEAKRGQEKSQAFLSFTARDTLHSENPTKQCRMSKNLQED